MDLNFKRVALYETRRRSALVLLPALASAATGPPSRDPLPRQSAAEVRRETVLMGTRLVATVHAASRARAIGATESAFAEVRRLDAVLSSWHPDSELSRLNRSSPGEPMSVSPELFALLQEVGGWVERTDRAFDPGVGALIDAWDLRGTGRRPDPDELASSVDRTGLRWFRFDPEAQTIARQRVGVWLSAGAFGKGAALRAAGARLRSIGIESALLDFGGQILARGGPEGACAWSVAVAHPARRDRTVAWLSLRDRSVATTGASERFVEVDGARYGHVLDPRTGRPVTAWGSVTVVAPDPMVADLLSTALFVLGPEAGWDWVERNAPSDVEALFLVEAGGRVEARSTPGMERWLVRGPDAYGDARSQEFEARIAVPPSCEDASP